MATHIFNLPTMYGDHHVLEVRRILMEMPGITEIHASSCFRVAEVSFDPAQLDAEQIKAALAKAGYAETLAIASERRGSESTSEKRNSTLRHAVAYEQTGPVISFAQETSQPEHVLWPCPGFGAIARPDEEE